MTDPVFNENSSKSSNLKRALSPEDQVKRITKDQETQQEDTRSFQKAIDAIYTY